MQIKTKKSLGQNFLNNKNILEKIVELGNVNKKKFVLEIGPGTGNLTKFLIEKKPKKLTVIEKDSDLAKVINTKFGENIYLVNDDFIKCYKNHIKDKPLIIFGNLPYNISVDILISLIKIDNLNKICEKIIFIFQKEVADRIISNHNGKKFGRISILTAWKMNAKKIFDIDPVNFRPIPKVWSSLLVLEPKKNYHKFKNIKNLEYITNIFFSQRRKMIKKPLNQLFKNKDIIRDFNFNLNARPQNLKIEDYFKICDAYEKLL